MYPYDYQLADDNGWIGNQQLADLVVEEIAAKYKITKDSAATLIMAVSDTLIGG